MPVSLALADPALRARELDRPPVVALADTALAAHPWFDDDSRVIRLAVADGELVPDATAQAAAISVTDTMTGSRGGLEGHGTFIAGLIRQGCPEATILSIPVMGNDGVAEEGDVIIALRALLERHIDGQLEGRPEDCIDVLSLSMGYYAEDDGYLSGPVKLLLDRFAEHGVLVVAGVGNDASTAPFVPAALAAEPPKSIRANSRPPLASVGALNPDGRSVALFSNALPVVSAMRPGVNLVSTLPMVDGAGQPSVSVGGNDPARTTMDPDNYQGGFGVWSGTSFATPVLAAELAAELVAAKDLADVDPAVMRKRAIRTLRSCLGRKTP